MAFDEHVTQNVLNYITAHLPPDSWFDEFFSFVDDLDLKKILIEEFKGIRYLYKIFEGLEADDFLLRVQIKTQITCYASIYEAVIHHLLFVTFKDSDLVKDLYKYPTKKAFSIPQAHMSKLEQYLEHDGKTIIPMYDAVGRTSITQIKFEAKANCAHQLGLISEKLKDELIQIYHCRNAIHLHAEMKKDLTYDELDLSKIAYRRMQLFREQILNSINLTV
ncbi:hypothetical protein B9T33_02235 [Acinetobacter sp. ANC 5054]|uniref:hypothetical protein n=1 Tax=Acinetobacter sp. ANC 5054 TaxID=1977877 RepID=UPI000A34FC9E|nr:hypothetical protein [Acinetobacter sp. ANC 5054]OTG84621.1 hypothetical protein B9T33_02235 [Acinetobacter sp. ANC 5054]